MVLSAIVRYKSGRSIVVLRVAMMTLLRSLVVDGSARQFGIVSAVLAWVVLVGLVMSTILFSQDILKMRLVS